jgi:hypothetical protein
LEQGNSDLRFFKDSGSIPNSPADASDERYIDGEGALNSRLEKGGDFISRPMRGRFNRENDLRKFLDESNCCLLAIFWQIS